MKANAWTIALSDEERTLLTRIELDAHALQGFEHNKENSKQVVKLMDSLTKRKAIPQHRLNWFTDPACSIGGHGKSQYEIFQNNLHGMDDVRLHPHFLAHLRYFIYGPELPEAIMTTFAKAVEDCGTVTSGDIIPLASKAKSLVRTHGLEKSKAADEFFKLALECDLSVSTASVIRKDIKTIR